MPVLTITNVSANNVSAPIVGTLTPGQAKSVDVLSAQMEKAGKELTSLKTAGAITFSVAGATDVDDVLEGDTLDNAGADSIAAAFTAHQAATVAAPATIAAYSAVVNMTDPVTKAQGEAMSAALAQLRTDVNALRTTVNSLITNLKAAETLASS